jgi:uncharacterized membrane protein YfcA
MTVAHGPLPLAKVAQQHEGLRKEMDVIASISERPFLMLAGSAMLILLQGALLDAFGLLPPAGGTLCMIAVLASAAVSSIAGFAFSAICAALLLPLIAEPVQAVTIMLLSSIAIQSLSVWTLRRTVDLRALLPFLLGGILGLPGGVYLLLNVQAPAYARLMGISLVVYGIFMLLRRPAIFRGGPVQDAVAGALGGVTGGLAAFPGALVTVWCGMRGWDKGRQRGVYQPFILVMQVLTLAVVTALAPSAPGFGVAAAAWAFVPAALLGTCCGLALYRQLSDRQFAVAVNLLLIAAGLGLSL